MPIYIAVRGNRKKKITSKHTFTRGDVVFAGRGKEYVSPALTTRLTPPKREFVDPYKFMDQALELLSQYRQTKTGGSHD